MSFLANNWDAIMTVLNAIGLLLVANFRNKV